MNPTPDKPDGVHSAGKERRLDLQAAYLVLIRAYLRQSGRSGRPQRTVVNVTPTQH